MPSRRTQHGSLAEVVAVLEKPSAHEELFVLACLRRGCRGCNSALRRAVARQRLAVWLSWPLASVRRLIGRA
eukprot:6194281-Pleurochrysis_carterae.AAC.1